MTYDPHSFEPSCFLRNAARRLTATHWTLFAAIALAAIACGDDENDTATGTGGTSGSSGASGSAGTAGAPSLGEPITAPDDTWTWVPFADAKCRDGSSTGIGVNLLSSSDKVVIYLMGGGACFNALTCGLNPATFGEAEFNEAAGSAAGIFDRNDPENPLRDYNFVFVPYCTGDVHSGNRPDGSIQGVTGTQAFVGYTNMTRYLERLVPTFPNATQVLLSGSSAGGFGASANFAQTQRYFGAVPVTLLNDSGPPMSTEYVPSCLQRAFREAWNLDATVLADCGATCDEPDAYLEDYVRFLATTYPDRRFATISSLEDSVIRQFYGFGANECEGLDGVAAPMDAAVFSAGLVDLRDRIAAPYPNFGSYYIASDVHTWLGTNLDETVNGVRLGDWIAALMSGSVSNVAP